MTPRAVHTRQLKNIAEMKQFRKDEGSKIPPDRWAGLILNYRKHLIEFIAAKGGSTRYYLCVHGVFHKDTKMYNCLCVISLSRLCVYCCDLDEDQTKSYDQFMQKSRYFQRVQIHFLATVPVLT